MKKIIICLLASFTFGSIGLAQVPSFNNISAAQLETITEEFGVGFAHTSVSSAASLGKVFGIEIAAIAGVVNSDGIKDIANTVSPGTDVGVIPHASLVGSVSFPMGLTAEISFLPNLDLSDISLKRTGFAGKWTMTDAVLSLPFDLAVKGHFTDASLSFVQSTPVATTVDFSSQILGASVIASKSFLIVEPYAGVGFVKVDGKLSAGASIFDTGLTTGTSAETDKSGLEYFAGVQLNLLILRAGIEYASILGNSKISGKLAFKF